MIASVAFSRFANPRAIFAEPDVRRHDDRILAAASCGSAP